MPLRIVFLGSDSIALPLLRWLAGNGRDIAQVLAVFTQPDRPAGRGQQVQPNAIKSWAQANNIPVLQPATLTPEVRAQLAEFKPDLSLVMAYGQILRDDFISTPALGTFNLHTSLLPKYRGASPIQTAIAKGERETGVTLMRIVRKLDAGPVAAVEQVPIEALDTALEVEAKLAAACVPLVRRSLAALAARQLTFHDQADDAATYCRKLDKTDGALDFAAPAAVLAARINGLFPWPGCTIKLGDLIVKIGLADTPVEGLLPQPNPAPGTVLGSDEAGLRVATGRGILRLLRLQRPGGRMLAAHEFLRGFEIPTGLGLPSQPMTELLRKPPNV